MEGLCPIQAIKRKENQVKLVYNTSEALCSNVDPAPQSYPASILEGCSYVQCELPPLKTALWCPFSAMSSPCFHMKVYNRMIIADEQINNTHKGQKVQ